MTRRALGSLTGTVKRLVGRLLRWMQRGIRDGERDDARRDPLAAMAAPPTRAKQPPYAALRQ